MASRVEIGNFKSEFEFGIPKKKHEKCKKVGLEKGGRGGGLVEIVEKGNFKSENEF